MEERRDTAFVFEMRKVACELASLLRVSYLEKTKCTNKKKTLDNLIW